MATTRGVFANLFPLVLVVVLLPSFCHAFGAGNIGSTARIEGQNWRHGDIEDTLLGLLICRAAGGKKFSKMDVKRVYFGNWLRDYSQAVDVGTVKSVSAEAIRIILWVLEHIDNPKDYADNLDARRYDTRLRGPVDERRELAIDPRTGLKSYIASEDYRIATSAGLVRNLFGKSIFLARQYQRSHNKADLYEALRLLGTGCHCLEDYSAHSNYTELALIELGERDVFPHVGRRTMVQVEGARHPLYPIVTGTFGGTDFLHSVMGEFSDKATQSEMQDLEGTISQSEDQGNASIVKDLLNKLPSGLFGGKDQAGKADELQANAAAAKMDQMHITPKQPEAFTRQLGEISKQIYPVLEFHDEIMQSITETIEKIPVLPALIEQVQEQISIFVFSLLAPFVLPIIRQVKTELATGSSEIIQSSKAQQLHVFNDDNDSNPTHSMLSKDHFSNVLNEPAGKVASSVLKWVVPQLMACWDDERVDADRTINRIINGVFHHPAMRDYGNDGAVDGRRAMFETVQRWWGDQNDYDRQRLRDQLSRDGVYRGRNHKEGVQDSGHGCGKPLGMPTMNTVNSSGAVGGAPIGSILSGISQTVGSSGSSGYGGGSGGFGDVGKIAGEAVGGGALGGIVGGLAGAVGASVLGGGGEEKKTYKQESYDDEGSHTTYTEAGYRPQGYSGRQEYSQSQYTESSFHGGGGRQEYAQYGQSGRYGMEEGSGYRESVETRPAYGGGYERTTTQRYEGTGGEYESKSETQHYGSSGQYMSHESRFEESSGRRRSNSDSDSDDSDDSDWEKKQRKREKKERKRLEKEAERRREERGDDYHSGYQSSSYNTGGSGYSGRQEESYAGGRYESQSSYGREDESGYGGRGSGYGGGSSGYGDSSGYGGGRSGYEGGGSRYGGGGSGYGGDGAYESSGYESRRQENDYEEGSYESRGYGGGGDCEEREEYGSGSYGGGSYSGGQYGAGGYDGDRY